MNPAPSYTFTHTPDPATLRRDLLAARAARPLSADFATTCDELAAEFRELAQWFYDDGDVSRGDRLTAKALAWELAAENGYTADVRP